MIDKIKNNEEKGSLLRECGVCIIFRNAKVGVPYGVVFGLYFGTPRTVFPTVLFLDRISERRGRRYLTERRGWRSLRLG